MEWIGCVSLDIAQMSMSHHYTSNDALGIVAVILQWTAPWWVFPHVLLGSTGKIQQNNVWFSLCESEYFIISPNRWLCCNKGNLDTKYRLLHTIKDHKKISDWLFNRFLWISHSWKNAQQWLQCHSCHKCQQMCIIYPIRHQTISKGNGNLLKCKITLHLIVSQSLLWRFAQHPWVNMFHAPSATSCRTFSTCQLPWASSPPGTLLLLKARSQAGKSIQNMCFVL